MSDICPTIRIQRIPECPVMPFPKRSSAGASGFDICAALENPLVIKKGERALIPSGFKIAPPPGWEIQVRPRSGLALKQGIAVLNSPGTIDQDYRGPLMVILINLGESDFTINPGDRIAQIVPQRIYPIEIEEVNSFEDRTQRGEDGFGSTGICPIALT